MMNLRSQPAAFAPAVAPNAGVREMAEHPHLLKNYARQPVEVVRGEGSWLIDANGERYLDMVAGIAVCSLGHARPEITEAIARQAATLVQASNLYYHEPSGTLANELARLSGLERVFFCNSGSEANEAAIKLARKLAWRREGPQTQRRTILACEGSFHGRTMGSLAATSNARYHEGFEPLPLGFAFVPYNDIAALERAIGDDTAAFLVEPIQGESGIIPADPEYLAAARRLCSERGALLIFDEIQCGMGRTGSLFAFESFGVRPDLVTMAKALSNGLPIGAVLIDEKAASGLQPGDHGTTFGGSPVPCAAALAHLRYRETHDLNAHVRAVSTALVAGLGEIANEHPSVFAPPRGRGLMLGLLVREPYVAGDFVAAARDGERLMINSAGRNTLRFVPPLTLSLDETCDAIGRLRRAIATVLSRSNAV